MTQPCSYTDPATHIRGLDGHSVCDYWRWAYSDLLSNTNRPILAEYLVGVALNALSGPRIEWDTTDLAYRGCTIEVKSAAYVQTWKQERPSAIRFEIAEHQRWNAETGLYEDGTCRHADCYVFCLLAEQNKNRVDPLDLAQWRFFVLATQKINDIFGDQKTVALSRISAFCKSIPFVDLKAEVDHVLFGASSNALTSPDP